MADTFVSHEIEEWRDVSGWPCYQVSSHGRVRSVGWGRERRILRQHQTAKRYMTITLTAPGQKRSVRVHRLVCEAFYGPAPEDRPEVAHTDGTRDNNHFTNLRWASHKENFADQVRHGTFSKPPSPFGKGRLSPVTLADIAARKAAGQPTAEIAAMYGVHRRTVNRIYRTGRP